MPRTRVPEGAAAPVAPPAPAAEPPKATSVADIENVGRAAAGKAPASKPWERPLNISRGLGKIVETIFPEGSIDTVNSEFDELYKALELNEALTPNAIRDALNVCEKRALRASRLHLIAKLDYKRYERECEIAIGAMREQATIELENEKAKGTRSKAPTIQDITDRAAASFPDEWREIHSTLENAKRTVDQLEVFADLWKGRRFTLAAMAGAGRSVAT